ncbi:LysR substrate-binding domain-containing protein [Streptomyces sp. NPDC002643]
MFDLHRLRLLRELKHRGTLAAVAAALSYAPSSVSQQLSQLEAEVGVTLLEPVGRRVRLTEQAEILVAHTEAVLERLERAEADIATSLTELTGTLRIASFQTAALALIPAALDRLRELHPKLRVHVTHMEPERALPALQARDFDLVLAEEYPGNPHPRPAELEEEDLLDDPLRLALPPGGAADGDGPQGGTAAGGGPPDALRSLADHPWVMEPEGTAARHWAMTLCRDAGFEPDVRFETTDLLLHHRLVAQGHAAAFLPDLVWSGHPPTVPLLRLPPGQDTRRVFTVVRRGGGRHPAVLACRAALRPGTR